MLRSEIKNIKIDENGVNDYSESQIYCSCDTADIEQILLEIGGITSYIKNMFNTIEDETVRNTAIYQLREIFNEAIDSSDLTWSAIDLSEVEEGTL